MWEISNNRQLLSVLLSLAFGVGYAVIYSFLKGFRKAVRNSALAIFFQDIIFFEIISFITFLLLLALEYGQIRLYVLLSMAVGFSLFHLFVSEFLSRIIAWILRLLILLFSRIFRFLDKAVGVFSKTVSKIAVNCIKKLRKCYKYLKKHLKGAGCLVYTKNTNTVDKKV